MGDTQYTFNYTDRWIAFPSFLISTAHASRAARPPPARSTAGYPPEAFPAEEDPAAQMHLPLAESCDGLWAKGDIKEASKKKRGALPRASPLIGASVPRGTSAQLSCTLDRRASGYPFLLGIWLIGVSAADKKLIARENRRSAQLQGSRAFAAYKYLSPLLGEHARGSPNPP